MKQSRIVGTGSYVPDRIVGNDEVAHHLGLHSSEQVYRLTGIHTRHWAHDDQASSDLAVKAATEAFRAAGISASEVEAIIVSTTSPDMLFPSTACVVQQALGAKPVASFDVAASCSGFLYGLSMADAMIRSGQVRCCVVIAAEVKSRWLDRTDHGTAMIFGDGAGAAVLVSEPATGQYSSGILGIRLYADGSGHELIRVPAGGSRTPSSSGTIHAGQHRLQMQGAPLFRHAIRRLERAILELMKEFGVTMKDLKQVIVHQANGRILSQLCRRLAIPADAMCSVIEQYGNASSASLPIALDHAVRNQRFASGDLVLLGTFGGGLTWATGLVRW
ncbi:MAG: 3-oxoacyl-ACP synthase III family protein [Nitrospiraceae bacterium]